MAQHNIEKWDPAYALLKPFVRLNFRGYFRSIRIRGKEHIPRDQPVIYAPNHHNALMDALAVLYALPGQPVFLARSDIFRHPFIARILTFLKLLPIYRIRDGYNSLQNNEKIMRKAEDVLAQKKSLVIFPEGDHAPERRLRPLKKGICRMAFQAEERQGFELGLQIVPVGLDYDNFYKFQHDLGIRFGRPIPVDPYRELYRQNPSKAHIALKKEIAGELKQLMVHIADQHHHDLINNLRKIGHTQKKVHPGGSFSGGSGRLEEDQKLIKAFEKKCSEEPQRAAFLDRQVRLFVRILDRLNLRTWVFNRSRYSWLSLLARLPIFAVLLPLFLYGLVSNALPFFLPVLAIRKIKDPQFWSSFKNGLALVLFPLLYLLQTVVVAVLTDSAWMAAAYLVSLPLTGYLAFYYYVGLKKWWARVRYNILLKKHPRLIRKIQHLRKDILHTMDEWTARK
jgi:1-acyl-sn-glycerol-3-phosphate acyltransferase